VARIDAEDLHSASRRSFRHGYIALVVDPDGNIFFPDGIEAKQ